MKRVKIEWLIDEQTDGKLLRQFLREDKQISKSALATIKFSGGKILVNGKEVTVRHILTKGDTVTIFFPGETRSDSMQSDNIPLHIIYEDEHYLLVNKPAMMATIPSREHPSGTLANAVLGYYEKHDIQTTFHAVNRLDKDTSGIVIIAKHGYAHDLLSKQQKARVLKRSYVAIVHGVMSKQKGSINSPIGRKEDSIIEREVRKDGQAALTHFEVVKYLEDATVVKLQLETGRTHQIRVHMASIGHPLLGDDLYGGLRNTIKRQALHSIDTSFFHPFLEKEVQFSAPIPEDMKQILKGAR